MLKNKHKVDRNTNILKEIVQNLCPFLSKNMFSDISHKNTLCCHYLNKKAMFFVNFFRRRPQRDVQTHVFYMCCQKTKFLILFLRKSFSLNFFRRRPRHSEAQQKSGRIFSGQFFPARFFLAIFFLAGFFPARIFWPDSFLAGFYPARFFWPEHFLTRRFGREAGGATLVLEVGPEKLAP